MPTTSNNPTSTAATATAPSELFVPAAVCDALAGRVRTAGLFLLRQVQGFLPVLRGEHAEAGVAELQGDDVQDMRLVVRH